MNKSTATMAEDIQRRHKSTTTPANESDHGVAAQALQVFASSSTNAFAIRTYINQPTSVTGENDVLLGRGGETNNHA
jgi:hypothetical protein